MSTREYRVLSILLAIALAFAPLRAVLPFPASAVPDGEAEHCTHLQTADQAAGLHQEGNDASDPDCRQLCDDGCCDGACGHCVSLSIGMPGLHPSPVRADGAVPVTPVACRHAGRGTHPPFRPPIVIS